MDAGDFHDLQVEAEQAGERLDRLLARQPGCSRRLAKQLLAAGAVLVDGRRERRGARPLRAGERIRAPRELPPVAEVDLATRILHRDEHWLAVDKPIGVPSSPTPFGERGSLLALLEEQLQLGQPPISVHRLDADVSGVMIVALTREGARRLTEAFTGGQVDKRYRAWVGGTPTEAEGRIEARIERDPSQRGRMRISPRGAPSLTEYRVLGEVAGVPNCAELELRLHTGRTHQLRVHLAFSLGCPVLGDRWYGGQRSITDEQGRVFAVPRLCLHSHRLTIAGRGESWELEAPVPAFLGSR